MALLKNILYELTVSSEVGSDYKSLNAAIEAVGKIKTFRIEDAVELTGNISFPSGITLIMGSQGSLSGSYVLTGNNTTIKFEGQNKCFETDITFAGTWKIEKICPEYFGAVGDGVTDDIIPLSKAHDLARLTNNKTVVFAKTYKTSDVLIITNTHSEFKNGSGIIGTNGKCVLKATGSLGTYYNLDSNALENSNVIVCSDSAFLASISKGDIVNIISNKLFALGYRQGEMQRIEEISGSTITFKDYLHDTYNTADTARVCRCNMAKYSNSGLGKISMPIGLTGDYDTDRATDGIFLNLVENADINFECNKFANSSIQISDCYEPRIWGRTHQGEMEGLGYGIAINGATMRAKIYGSYIGHRAGVDAGGSITGVPWDVGCYGVTVTVTADDDGAGFLTHYNTGSFYCYDCIVFGAGISETRHAGYTLNARYNRLVNCKTMNLYRGIYSTGTAMKQVEIINFSGVNCAYGLTGSPDSAIPDLIVDGFSIHNDSVVSGVGFYLAGSTITKWSFKNLDFYNLAGGISLATNDNTYPDTLIVDGFSHTASTSVSMGIGIVVTHASLKTIIIRNLISRNASQVFYANATTADLDHFEIQNGFVENFSSVKPIEIYAEVDYIGFSNVTFKNPLTESSKIVYLNNGVVTLRMIGCHTEGTNMDYLTDVVNTKTFTNFQHMANDFVGLAGAHLSQTPTNTLTSGSIGL